MKYLFVISILFVFSSCNHGCINKAASVNDCIIEGIRKELQVIISMDDTLEVNSVLVFPKSINSNGGVNYVGQEDWTSGYLPGSLWLMHEITGDAFWKDEAIKYTYLLKEAHFNAMADNIGQKMMCSFGNGYRINSDPEYRSILISSARLILDRFNESLGLLIDYFPNRAHSISPLSDNAMMDLELLFFAYHETGDPVFYNVAVKHAETIMNINLGKVESPKDLFKPGFDLNRFNYKYNKACELYGFIEVYKETKNPVFLIHSENIANTILELKKRKIHQDTLTIAILSSALYKLSGETKHYQNEYRYAADELMTSLLSQKYSSINSPCKRLLTNKIFSKEILGVEKELPMLFADYYLLEGIKERYNFN